MSFLYALTSLCISKEDTESLGECLDGHHFVDAENGEGQEHVDGKVSHKPSVFIQKLVAQGCIDHNSHQQKGTGHQQEEGIKPKRKRSCGDDR